MVDAPLRCVIEIPRGIRNKYEYDPELGAIKLDRFISASVVYPTDYGGVLRTRSLLDGDPLDVLVCVSEPTFPGVRGARQPDGVVQDERREGTRRPCRVRSLR